MTRQTTSITDENIRGLVRSYIEDGELPADLQVIPIGEWDVSRVTKMDYVFSGFTRFNEPLHWDTRNVISMSFMFRGCKKFNQHLDWQVYQVTTMEGMFHECCEFNKPIEWTTHSLENTKSMFHCCRRLNKPIHLDMGNVKTTERMFSACYRFNQSLDWDMGNVKTTEGMFGACKQFNQPLDWDMKQVKTTESMFVGCTEFNEPLDWKTPSLENTKNMFHACTKLNKPIQLTMGNVTDMTSMFSECNSFNGELTGTDTPEWDVRKVVTMEAMFSECFAFNRPLQWNTDNVTTVSSMFSGCEKLNSPIQLNLAKVTDMSFMFSECTEFNQELNFDVSQVTTMENLFQNCEHFNRTLRWNVSNVVNMFRAFAGCERFNSPLMGVTEPHWNVTNVTSMDEMFSLCRRFNKPLVWNVSNVVSMYGMFQDCIIFDQPLHWTLTRLMECELMFAGCINFDQDLTGWEITPGANVTDMFLNSGMDIAHLPRGTELSESDSPDGPLVEVDARQIHQFSSKVDIEKLNAFFQSKTTFDPKTVKDMPGFIERTLKGIIDQLDAHVLEQETEKRKELDQLKLDIKTDTNAELSRLVPLELKDMLERLYQKKKTLLDKIHTSKQLTHPLHYVKKIDRLLSMATMKRKEALEREKGWLTELDKVDKEIKGIRMDKKKKDRMMALLEERDKMKVLSGRQELLVHEIKNERNNIIKHRIDLEKIMNRVLRGVNFSHYSPPWRMSILYALDYVDRQPILFKKAYTEAFLKDCVNAYEGAGGMSCSTGVMERFVISLMTGCGTMLSVAENPEYVYIKGIVENGLTKLIPEYILKWYKLHSDGSYRFTTETREQRLDNLKQYLLSFFPENEELILKLIPQYAIDVDNDDFAYKKENSAERINMNEVYASASPKEHPKTASILSRLTKLIPRSRKKTIQPVTSTNRLKMLVSNRKTKNALKRPTPKPRVRTIKKYPFVLGTAFG